MSKQLITLMLVIVMPAASFAQVPSEAEAASRNTIYNLGLNKVAAVLEATNLETQNSCDTSRAMGRNHAADRHSTAGWLLGGVGCGAGLGLIGTGIFVSAGALTSPQLNLIPYDVDEDCYRDGYRSKAKNKSLISALIGGLTGTAVWLSILAIN